VTATLRVILAKLVRDMREEFEIRDGWQPKAKVYPCGPRSYTGAHSPQKSLRTRYAKEH
jgi:hypothetical protein